MSFERDAARRRLAKLAEPYARPRPLWWRPVPAELDQAIAADRDLRDAARRARAYLVDDVARHVGKLVLPSDLARYTAALLDAPRERFVRPEDIASSADDAPLPLDEDILATVSAPHAYLLTFGLLGLAAGDHLIELGTGTGYGASLASHVVGERGAVTSIEIDPALHARASRVLAAPDAHGAGPVTLIAGDARALAPGVIASARAPGTLRVAVTYALPDPPEDLIRLLPEGGRLCAPVGPMGGWEQSLVLWSREAGVLERSEHGTVRYVAERR